MRLALAGDAMLGRKVAERISESSQPVFAPEVVAVAATADVFILNLECCISERGEPWSAPGKPFFFRAPPMAVGHLRPLGVDAVTLANNHALDYGPAALIETLDPLRAGGIAVAGAGPDRASARRPVRLAAGGSTIDVVALADHPADFAAGRTRPGTAYADLRRGTPSWVVEAVERASADVVVVTPHWGPNMTTAPPAHVLQAADGLVEAGATVIAGHSAHVFHGVRAHPGRIVCYDLGDFIDDYAVDSRLRNDLGLLWLIDFDGDRPARLEAVPLVLDYCYTRLAEGDERDWIARRLTNASAEFGTTVSDDGTSLAVPLS